MFARGLKNGSDGHAEKKNGQVAGQQGDGMSQEKIFEPRKSGGFLIPFPGHDRIGAEIGVAQFGIMRVVMVVRMAPGAAGAKEADADDAHQKFREARFGQDGAMLVVVVNDKEPDHQQSRQPAAHDAQDERQSGQGSRQGGEKEKRGGQDAPPAFPGIIPGIGSGASEKGIRIVHVIQNQIFCDGAGKVNEVRQLFPTRYSRAGISGAAR